MTDDTETPTTEESVAPAQPRCANCGAPLHGEFCYACGQPVKGLIRHLSGVAGDFMDSVLNLDSRTFRTLGPLLVKPGYLTLEYFAGRRMRYVTPFRLFFFLCIVSFFAAQTYVDVAGKSGFAMFQDDAEDKTSIAAAPSAEEVQKRLDAGLAGLEAGKNAPDVPEKARKAMDRAETAMRKQAAHRVETLQKNEALRAAGKPVPNDNDEDDTFLSFDGTPWDPKDHPIAISWLPKFCNDKLNDMAEHMRQNLVLAKKDPKHLVAGLFSVLPQTLFVLMPLFAVLLKVMYLFKRRLYMEHLIVALHSHAFVFAAILLMSIFGLLQVWMKDVTSAFNTPLDWAIAAVGWWIPLYLLITQKRVYRQGWPMTLLKFGFIGVCYFTLIVTAVCVALVVSLAVA